MKAKVIQMVKETLIEGLKRSKFDFLRTRLSSPNGGMFTSREDRLQAYQIANIFLDGWQGDTRKGEQIPFNFTEDELERYLDIHLAEMSFMDAYAMVNNRFINRSNKELIKEAQEAINVLNRLGGDAAKTASSYEAMLKRRIGEE